MFCAKSGFKNLKIHERQCPLNENRTSAVGHKGKNQYTYGSLCSDETKKKISESQKSRKLSDETKQKISESLKKFLDENPDKVPYKVNHSSKESYPESYFRECFDGLNITQEYRIGRYSLDFANVDKRLYFEVDGEQHYTDKKVINIDIVRTQMLEELGWHGVRCRWSTFSKLNDAERQLYVNEVKEFLEVYD